MIGRTPEYLSKKIGIFEMKMALIVILVPGILVLVFTGIALVTMGGTAGIFNPGPHGLSEIVYAFASMANNNGSAFAGLDAAAPFYTLSGVIIMAIGRFIPAVAILALAGSAAEKKAVPSGPGTLPTATIELCPLAHRGDPDHRGPDLLPPVCHGASCRTAGPCRRVLAWHGNGWHRSPPLTRYF